MRKYVTYVASVAGAAALVGTVLTNAFAGAPDPIHTLAKANRAKQYNVAGNLEVKGVMRVDKNNSVYGTLYAHHAEQVWQGLLVHSGGVNSDSLKVTGSAEMQSAIVDGNLQANGTLNVTGAATLNSTLNVNGKVTSNGLDAGAGGITTAGSIQGGGVTATSVTDSGALTAQSISSASTLTAGSISTSGTLSAGQTTVTGLTATGTVNLSNATVTLPQALLNSLTVSPSAIQQALSGTTLAALNVGTLNLGSTGTTSAPLILAANGKSATVGVDQYGNLTAPGLNVGNLTVTGSVSLPASGTLTASTIQGPPTSTTNTTPGTVTLQGTGINLNGTTTLTNGSDLQLTSNGVSTSHILANSDRDVTGLLTININQVVPGSTTSVTYTFAKPYTTLPIVVVTPEGLAGTTTDPAPGVASMPKVWVSVIQSGAQYTGFTLYYVFQQGQTQGSTINFGYHVFGS